MLREPAMVRSIETAHVAQTPALEVRFARPLTHAATIIAVVGALAPTDQVSGVRYLAAIGLGVALATLGTWGATVVERRADRTAFAQYFVAMSTLSAAIVVVTDGYATIAVMPTLSQAVLFGSIWYGLGGGLATLGLLTWTLQDSMNAERLSSVLLGFGGAIAFVLIFSIIYRREAHWRAQSERLREQLAVSNLQLRLHAEQVEELAATRERNRLARELHDGLGHYLTAIHVQLEAARALLHKSPDAALNGITRAQLLSRQGLADVRQSVSLLREDAAEGEPGLAELLQTIIGTFRTDEQPVEFNVHGELPPVAETTRHALRRVLQEALSNVHHHAGGSRTTVRLSHIGSELQLDVRDDGSASTPPFLPSSVFGKGAPRESDQQPSPDRSPLGLLSVRERVEALGGTLVVDKNERGFHLEVRVPL